MRLILGFLAIGLLGCKLLLAQQATFVTGNSFPTPPSLHTWFYHQYYQQLHYYDGSDWVFVVDKAYKEIFVCRKFLFAKTGFGTDIYDAFSRHLIVKSCQVAICTDSVEGYLASNQIELYDARKNVIALTMLRAGSCSIQPMRQSVRGIEAYCVPKDFGKAFRIPCMDMHTWGMLATDGQWLIPPQYDKPFYFQNGRATVTQYGRTFIIDERGEEQQ